MGKAIDAEIGRDQCLYRAADAEKIRKLVDGVIFCDQHQRAHPHQQATQVKWKHGLDRPSAHGIIPYVPRDLVTQQDHRKRPADFTFGRVAGILEAEQEKIQQEEEDQCAAVGGAEELKGGTKVVIYKKLTHKRILLPKVNGTELQYSRQLIGRNCTLS